MFFRRVNHSTKERNVKKMKKYIDMHCHILPGIDDGAKNEKEAMKMLRCAYEEGTRLMIATPHYHYSRGNAEPKEIRTLVSRLQELVDGEGMDLKIYPGNELYYSHDLLQKVKEGEVLTLADSRYVLLEFSVDTERRRIRNALYEFLNAGYLPIVAHMERYQAFRGNDGFVEEVYDMGAYLQINGSSLYGKNPWGMKLFCRKMMQDGLVHFVATDAHDLQQRPVSLMKTAEWIGKKMGSLAIKNYLYKYPQMIINNERI